MRLAAGRPRRGRTTVAVASWLAVAAFLAGACTSGSPRDALQSVPLQPLSGGEDIDLTSLEGSPLVVNLWATWCAPCRTEMPDLQAASEAAGGDVRFIGISNDTDPAKAQEMADDLGVTYDLYLDSRGEAQAAYEVTSLPTTLFFAADGTLVESHTGILDEDGVRERIEQIESEG